MPKRLAVCVPISFEFCRELILGVSKYCNTHNAQLTHFALDQAPFPENIDDLGAHAAIVFLTDKSQAEKARRWKIPIVNISTRGTDFAAHSVITDDQQIGYLGASFFIERGQRNLVFCGITGHKYSSNRFLGFKKRALESNIKISEHDEGSFNMNDRPANSPLVRWLDHLPKPVAIMACNDHRARHLIEACRILNLSLPGDVLLLGVDNDPVICQGMSPTLTSIDPNPYRIGFEAALAAFRLLEKKSCPPIHYIPPLGIVPRASTLLASADDPAITAAITFIRDNAERPISVPAVARSVSLNRRTLERRFKLATGFTIADAVRNAHLDRAKQLLIDTDLTLEEVAESSGLGYVRQMRTLFARHEKCSPSAYRNSFKS